jgi:hypothetical protein
VILRCPDSGCHTTYDTAEDEDEALSQMIKHYRYNLRHQGFGHSGDNRGVISLQEAALAVSNANQAD